MNLSGLLVTGPYNRESKSFVVPRSLFTIENPNRSSFSMRSISLNEQFPFSITSSTNAKQEPGEKAVVNLTDIKTGTSDIIHDDIFFAGGGGRRRDEDDVRYSYLKLSRRSTSTLTKPRRALLLVYQYTSSIAAFSHWTTLTTLWTTDVRSLFS